MHSIVVCNSFFLHHNKLITKFVSVIGLQYKKFEVDCSTNVIILPSACSADDWASFLSWSLAAAAVAFDHVWKGEVNVYFVSRSVYQNLYANTQEWKHDLVREMRSTKSNIEYTGVCCTTDLNFLPLSIRVSLIALFCCIQRQRRI